MQKSNYFFKALEKFLKVYYNIEVEYISIKEEHVFYGKKVLLSFQ